MSLADLEKPRYPLEGVPIDDLATALSALAATPELGQAKVLRIEARQDGHLVVQTGFMGAPRAGGGKYLFLRRSETGWVVAEISPWKS
jgi:hypothetical protein